MATSHMEKTLIGLAGEFMVAGQLCLRGYVASLTLKNYPKVDIFCLNPDDGKQVAIQVKTKRGGNSYYIPENIDGSENPFVFVYIGPDDSVEYYILSAEDVARLSREERDEYLRSRPHVRREQPRMLSLGNMSEFKDRWDGLWACRVPDPLES